MPFNRYKTLLIIPFAPRKSFSRLTDEEAGTMSLVILVLFSFLEAVIRLQRGAYFEAVSANTVVFGVAVLLALTIGSVIGCFLQAYLVAGALNFINKNDVTRRIRWAVPFALLPYLLYAVVKLVLPGQSFLLLDILFGLWSFWILVSLLSLIKQIPVWKAAAAVLLLCALLALPIALLVGTVYYFNY
jgi:hypothetical protein